MRILGITGAMGSGKSTAVEILKELYPDRVFIVKFAQPLYNIQEEIYKIISPVYKRPDTFVKDRKLLQWLGTEWGRSTIGISLWTDLWQREAKYIIENYPNAVVIADDLRFDNEAEVIKGLSGGIIKLESASTTKRIDTTAGIAGHPSESGIDLTHVDFIIENNGTLDDLRTSLLALNNELKLW